MYYKLVKGIRILYPLNNTSFEKEDVIKLLCERFGWKDYGGKHHESRYTKFIHTYYLLKKFNIDDRRLGLSLQVCEGKVTRDDANELHKLPAYITSDTEADKQYIAKRLGITADALNKIIDAPARW